MPKVHERTLSRQMAVAVLYQAEAAGKSVDEIVASDCPVPDGGALPAYAVQLLELTCAHADEADRLIEHVSRNWSVDRMPMVDRAIMRLAVCEMRHVDDVPLSVTVNEAVELAKAFGGQDESPRFANGILGEVARLLASDADVEAIVAPPQPPEPQDAGEAEGAGETEAGPGAAEPDADGQEPEPEPEPETEPEPAAAEDMPPQA